MEMSLHILEMLSYFHYFYSQLLFRQYKKSPKQCMSWTFSFFLEIWKIGYWDWERGRLESFAYDNL